MTDVATPLAYYVVICPFSASWRIVRIAIQPCPTLCMMQLACVAASTDRGVQLHRDAWPINAHLLDTRYAPRVLHFSAFHFNSVFCKVNVK